MTVFIPFDNRYRVTVSCPHCAQIVPLFASEESLRIASHEIPGGGGVCPESGKVLGRIETGKEYDDEGEDKIEGAQSGSVG